MFKIFAKKQCLKSVLKKEKFYLIPFLGQNFITLPIDLDASQPSEQQENKAFA